jgi:hypothetical protein
MRKPADGGCAEKADRIEVHTEVFCRFHAEQAKVFCRFSRREPLSFSQRAAELVLPSISRRARKEGRKVRKEIFKAGKERKGVMRVSKPRATESKWIYKAM